MQVEKYKCEKCKRVCKESIYKVTSIRNFNRDTNKPNKEMYIKTTNA